MTRLKIETEGKSIFVKAQRDPQQAYSRLSLKVTSNIYILDWDTVFINQNVERIWRKLVICYSIHTTEKKAYQDIRALPYNNNKTKQCPNATTKYYWTNKEFVLFIIESNIKGCSYSASFTCYFQIQTHTIYN